MDNFTTRYNTRNTVVTPYKQAMTAEHKRLATLVYTVGMLATIHATIILLTV
jgi:hypothetical protein